MNLQATLENELIILRPLALNDLEALYEVAKDPSIWEQHPCRNRHELDVYTSFFKDSIEAKGALVVIEKSNNKIIGSSRFKIPNDLENTVEIGWSFLSREYWGGQYNKAVKRLMIDHAFNTLEYVILYIGKENIRSQKATEKLGAIRLTESSRHQRFIKKGQTNFTYLIDREKWKS